jgi:hypothetical protein
MTISTTTNGTSDRFDLDALLHPARTFAHPRDVLRDPGLTRDEKRAILASWASDACAVEAAPELRHTPIGNLVRFDDIMDALRLLDQETAARDRARPPHQRRSFVRRFPRLLGCARDERHAGQNAVQDNR